MRCGWGRWQSPIHDSVAAIPAARAEIARAELPLTLITGVEISTLWENHEIHIVGLNIDIDHSAMTQLLCEQKARRNQRGQMIAERLEKARIPGAWEGALKLAMAARSPAAILPAF
ncbi:COG0613, Predicted metal-dependent phosphoesterases (PHP family) [Klebsiella aerogenes]|nr:COG0613, Predicted metal-dependent phosphoesterases (PHP family) [Klebsiella aerogenes]